MIRDGSKKALEIANVCYANVSRFFADMCDEKNRGPQFKWVNFPDMAQRRAKEYLVLAGLNKVEYLQYAEDICFMFAQQLVDRAGFSKEE